MDWGELLWVVDLSENLSQFLNDTWLSHVRGESVSVRTLTSQEPLSTIQLYTWTSSQTPLHTLPLLLFSLHDLQSLFLTDCSLMHTHRRSRGSGPQDQRYTCVNALPHTIIECLQLCLENVTKPALPYGKNVLCSMAAEWKSVSNSWSLCNIHWIYTVR